MGFRKLLSILALLCCASAFALPPAALVSHGGNAAGTVPSLNGTGGNFIAICALGNYPAWPSAVPTDSSGNTYSAVLTSNFPGYSGVTLWTASTPTVTSSMTFYSNSGYPLAVMIFSGVASGPDKTNTSTTLASGNITPTNANELILSCIAPSGTSAPTGVSPLTLADSVSSPGALASAYQIQTTATTVQATWTGTGNPSNLIASFYSDETPAPLVVTNTALPEGFVSTAYGSTTSIYSNQLTASGGNPPYTWSCPSTCTLPSTLSVSSGGLITGTPTAAQSATNATLKVTDSQSNTATVTLPLTIASTLFSVGAGTCTGSALNGTQLAAYAGCTISATGGKSPYGFTISTSADTLPEGLSLNTFTGAISGTIYGQGGYQPSITVEDSLGSYAVVMPIYEIAGQNMSSGCLPMTGSIFSQRVDSLPIDTSPAAPIYSGYLTASLRIDGGPGPDAGGIPFLIVPYNQATNTVTLVYPGWGVQSSFPPYSVSSPSPGVTSGGTIAGSGPIPSYAPIEDTANGVGQDQHVIVIQEAGGGNPCREFDQWVSAWTGSEWTDSSNLNLPNIGPTGSNAFEMNFQGNGSTDAAGLPIAPLLANAQEVIGTGTPTSPNGAVQHPIRFTLNTFLNRHVWPAVGQPGEYGSCSGGYAGGGDSNGLIVQPNSGANQPPTSCTHTMPMGEIYRLKASVFASLPSCFATSPQASIIATGLKQYGMIVSDKGNTGALVLTNDSQWNSTDLSCLRQLNLGEFEPVNVMGVAANLDANGLPTVSYQTTSSSPTAGAQTSGAVKFSGGVVLQ